MAERPNGWRITCRDADWLMSLQRDTPLPRSRRVALWLHLRYCDSCRTVRRNLDLLARAVRRF